MFRYVFLCLGFCLAAASSAAECDARSVWRGTNTLYYTPKVETCLTAPPEGLWFDPEAEADIFARVNEARQAAGLPALQLRAELLTAARIHSLDMAQEDFIAHEGPDKRFAGARVAALDRTLIHSEVRENIALLGGDLDYSDTAYLLHAILMNSEGHKENILAPNVTHMAIGLVRKEKGAWVTQVFVRVEGELTAPLPYTPQAEAVTTDTVALTDWTFAEAFWIDADDKEYNYTAIDPAFRGDLQLLVTATKRVDERRRALIKLRGPSVSVLE